MIPKLSLALTVVLWVSGLVYLGLLTNWLRYPFSLEAAFVAAPLMIGLVVSSIFAIMAYRRCSPWLLIGALVATIVTGCLVVTAQLQAFGSMPSFYASDIDRSPVGRVTTPQGHVDYWIELENPFARAHSEYVVIRREAREYRLKVPMFDKPLGGYGSANTAEDWGKLSATSDPNIFVLTLGPSLLREGRFKINLATGQVETIQMTNI